MASLADFVAACATGPTYFEKPADRIRSMRKSHDATVKALGLCGKWTKAMEEGTSCVLSKGHLGRCLSPWQWTPRG
jgi:hypothetical protein